MIPLFTRTRMQGTISSCLTTLMHSIAVLTLSAAVTFLVGCSSEPVPLENETTPDEGIIGNHSVPIYPTAEEQLWRARSLSPYLPEKAAWLEAVSRFHPDARYESGLARLELAYLKLGNDYREANSQQVHEAVQALEQLVENHEDQPAILCGSLWYLGWIQTELAHDIPRGLQHFRRILQEPEAFPPIRSAAGHWPGLEPEGTPTDLALPQFHYSWQDLARLEIIRYSGEPSEALRLLQGLTSPENDHPRGHLYGRGILLLLNRFPSEPQVVALAKEFLRLPDISNPVRFDLNQALDRLQNLRGGNTSIDSRHAEYPGGRE